jgi:hypothetical protein
MRLEIGHMDIVFPWCFLIILMKGLKWWIHKIENSGDKNSEKIDV